MLEQIELLILDLDGTLVDTKDDITFSLNKTLRHYSLEPVKAEVVAAHVGTGITPLLKERTPAHLFATVMETFEQTYLEHIADATRLFPGWDEVFAACSSKRLYILTNKIQIFTDALIDALDMKRHFVTAYGREAFAERKPSPMPVINIMKQEETAPERTLMVGDMPADLQSGKNAGAKTCAALFGYGKKDALLELHPDYVIERPVDLLKIP